MTGFPRPDYRAIELYHPDRRPVPVDLSDNTNLWGSHPAALRVVREAEDRLLARYPTVYADPLREAAARKHGVAVECVTTGCGSDDVLDAAFRAAGGATGARAVLVDPTFSMAEVLARMNGLEPHALPREALAGPPRAFLEPGPALVYLCSPNNPTGEALDPAWVRALLDAAGPGGPLVVLDEAYADFAGRTLVADAPGTERLLVTRTLSKAYGLAGLRVGYAVGPRDVVREVDKARGPYKVSALAERAAAAALNDDEGWADGVVRRTVENRERLRGALEDRGLRPLPSLANFVLVPTGAVPALELAAWLRDEGVAIRPFPGLRGIGEAIRVSLGPWPLLERFLEALDRVLARRESELDHM